MTFKDQLVLTEVGDISACLSSSQGDSVCDAVALDLDEAWVVSLS